MKWSYYFFATFLIIFSSQLQAMRIYNKEGNKIDVYGKMEVKNVVSDSFLNKGDKSFIEYGVKGETQISDQIYGFFKIESKIKIRQDQKTTNNLGLGFIGVDFGEMGSIDYGRNYGVLYEINSWTSSILENNTVFPDNFLSHKANSVLTYRNKNFFGNVNGLNFVLQYQGKNVTKSDIKDPKVENGQGFGTLVYYDFDNGISTGASYTNHKKTKLQKSLSEYEKYLGDSKKNAQSYALGIKYDINSLYLSALYKETRNMSTFGDFDEDEKKENLFGFPEKIKNIELVAQYNFGFGFCPSIGYSQSSLYDKKAKIHNHFIEKYLELCAKYNFNKNVSTFFDCKINLLKKNKKDAEEKIKSNLLDINKDNKFSIGIKYSF
ncbi:porin [bacterium endosymbiont of Pedicinus badii]|uniref:porin n=1 Tax=bacterium endosymbiont of Pedicinus badii TaxID=1719126 RepID=UPI0009BC639D|nr:porin [bacterium endosymbiont of Pedicinus badii]OQM34440.1 hypothetical protein AOQ89_00945 [bacterium endosymbiont of Pedicinus badii]